MRRLTQAAFKNCPPHVRSASVVKNGMAYGFEVPADTVRKKGLDWALENETVAALSGRFDATDWQNSVIDREPVK